MSSERTFLPRNRYLASAKPPKLLSVTTLTVYVAARKMELINHCPNGSSLKSWRKLSRVSQFRCFQGKNAYANVSLDRLNAPHASQRGGVRLISARMNSAAWTRTDARIDLLRLIVQSSRSAPDTFNCAAEIAPRISTSS